MEGRQHLPGQLQRSVHLKLANESVKRVVARDGIEPPTPAFSGPRSTTELSGLSRYEKLHESARSPGLPVRRCRVRWDFPLAVRSKQPDPVYQSKSKRPNPAVVP